MAIEEEEEAGIPEWVVTFGDMMSLLLTFFIMLVSMSEIKDKEQFHAMVDALQKRFGYDNTISNPMPGPSKPRKADFSKLANAGRDRLRDLKRGGVKIRSPVGSHSHPIVVPSDSNRESIGAPIFFVEKSAELTKEATRRLDEIVVIVKGKPQKIVVSGHTTRMPVKQGSGYADNWDLAFQRTQKTMQYLIEHGGLDRQRFLLRVAGPNESLPKDFDVGKWQPNSRVMVYLIDEVVNQTPGISKEK